MPGLNGLEITRQVHQQSPATAVIVLSMYSKDEYVIQALRNGASGYVSKHAKPAELVRAIRTVLSGRCYLSRPLSGRPLATWLRKAEGPVIDDYETLTRREREVLLLASEGHSSARIASHLSIGRRTAESHRASLMHKLRFRNQTDLIRYVLARAITGPVELARGLHPVARAHAPQGPILRIPRNGQASRRAVLLPAAIRPRAD